MANQDDGTISVLLGNGDGTFQSQQVFSAGATSLSVATADFNGDGYLDLAVGYTTMDGSSGVSVLLGNGDGTFQAPTTFPVSSSPYSVIAADFNHDSKMDLAVTNYASGTISILLGNGDGTFGQAAPYAVGNNPFGLASGDFNGDGKLDLSVTNYSDSSVSVLLGNGDGTFQGQIVFLTNSGARGVATGDFNDDGRLDLAVTDCCVVVGNTDTISVFLQSPGVTLKPSSLSFGNQALRTTSSPLPVLLTNNGSAALSIAGIAIGGTNSIDFAQTNDCPALLSAGANCTIEVTFTPLTMGSLGATLAVSDNASGSPQTVSLSGVGTSTAPTITTQPASQNINYGQTATLTVLATGTPPLSYQWYLGASGDTTNPVAGATNSSFTTPALTATTSYWVQVSNAEGSANSQTATITVELLAPVCTLSLQTPQPSLTVTATANCTDPQGEALTIIITWGDGTSTPGSSGSHTYAVAGNYTITVKATDTSGRQGIASGIVVQTAPPVMAGQTSNIPVSITAPVNSTANPEVKFVCTTVIGPNGSQNASDAGITCTSNPPTVTLSSTPQNITIEITTTGATLGSLSPDSGPCLVLRGLAAVARLDFRGLRRLDLWIASQKKCALLDCRVDGPSACVFDVLWWRLYGSSIPVFETIDRSRELSSDRGGSAGERCHADRLRADIANCASGGAMKKSQVGCAQF